MASFIVRLNIEPEELLRLYQGVARNVNAVSLDGKRVVFPANILKPFVTHSGVQGVFEIFFTPEHRFETIKKIDLL